MAKKTLFVISTLPLAEGQGASFARILAYAKALTLEKDTEVYLLSDVYPDDFKESLKEIAPKIYLAGKKRDSGDQSNFTKRTAGKVFGKKAFNQFLENVSHFLDGFEGEKAVLVYPSIHSYSYEKELIKRIRSKSIKVFSERNELNIGKVLNSPFPKNPVKKIVFGLYYPFKYYDHYLQDKLVSQYDGNIVISKTMENHVAKQNGNLIRIPILADVAQFEVLPKTKKQDESLINIGFTGTINNKKDGINELIDAIAILDKKHGIQNVQLNLYGSGYRDVIAKLKKQISDLSLSERVILHGKVASSEIPGIMVEQDILVLTRPDSLQARYGFSTKLAEYMASGVVVLATDVSDNALFIEDGVNGFIAKSHVAQETASKLAEIISKKEYSNSEIKKKGRATASEYFQSEKYADELSNFLFPGKASA